MERTHIALVHKDPDSDYGVSFPDLPGCITVGSTIEEAREMAREVLALHLEGMAADGERIPPACSADAALAHEDAFDAIALIVVEALPERTEEEARAELEAFLASDEYQEIYGSPITEDDLDGLPNYQEYSSETLAAGIGLRPVTGTDADRTYAALARQDTAGHFGVGFPDLPGCFTVSSALEKACKSARRVLARHLEDMAARGETIPNPSSASEVLARLDAADAVALIVVEAVPAQEASLASDEYREIYGEPTTV